MYSLGIDYGTNSVRALVVDVDTGAELGTWVYDYPSGQKGILLDPTDPDLARQNPRDYLVGLEGAVKGALARAAEHDGFDASRVVGIGVDTTGSTPIPVDVLGQPLAFQERFRTELDAYVWLWKDHTGHAEARRITETAARMRPHYLAKCGGTYSAEWYWAKILHCLHSSPDVFDAAHTWVEHADWIPAILTGTERPAALRRSVCAAGHKAMYHREWGGYPDAEFLAALDPRLVRLRDALPNEAHSVADAAGGLTVEWAGRLGLPTGIPVAVGAFDAHLGAVGSGIRRGTLVKIIGTSTCDLMIAPLDADCADVPGLCGVVPESVLPGQFGLEAGQSAVGDIFNWFVEGVKPAGKGHAELTAEAERLRPGESGLLALDWLNGNRTVLVDQRLTGMILGLTLHTTPAEIYRALVEATAFGARVIMERYEEYGDAVDRIVNCGGISDKNPFVMQIYADVMGRPVQISRSAQTCALGAAVAGAVVAGTDAGGHDSFDRAMQAMTGVRDTVFEPVPERRAVYDRLYALYRRLHDAFGVPGANGDLYDVMKDLLDIRDEMRRESHVA
ncbi:Carbohydrate kinase, FGGY (plasmid) [Gemmatirosa kalamazoonensis]|uniref:Carbohydrate kinase, FGGY n=1 Tax=Gemmatirosa kalamazoonensis TaxID=861299 RepID=W0RN02_9BACT|nr:ribulokinase [Gemmatirosa kalamazoonensis]AHG92419.1 Carbohydrate kinase, FGGY [Gemmatirosa kalamazoonensis]